MLRALLALQQAVLRLQGPVTEALRARAFDFLRLQLLHALLQAIDPALPLCGLTRERVALPLLRCLLALLDQLLPLLRALVDPLRRQPPLAYARRRGRTRWRGDMRTLRGRSMKFGPRRCGARRGDTGSLAR
ncbi:hypothetical protein [Bradyrhizobium sp. i1.12.3]|uniref:hypothetical protein n=1 Tax=unclassified Bradyrhizobium TaxID=2631580 RepID=UPI003D24EE9F